jgi:hypothetical protein
MNINWIKITKVGAGAAAKTASVQPAEEPAEIALNVYPSPVENTLYVTTDLSGGSVKIVDSQTGSTVASQKINNNSFDVSHLKQGIYFIVFEKDGKQTIKRFIKK